jgi:hypothetical protein
MMETTDPKTIGILLISMFAIGGLIAKILAFSIAPFILGILILIFGLVFIYGKVKMKPATSMFTAIIIVLLLGMLVYTVV